MLRIREILVILVVLAVAGGVYAWKAEALPHIDLNGGPDISRQAQAHILHGDKNGGGHLYGTGKPCKTEFPQDWDASDIISHVRKTAANDNLNWKKEKNGYYTATDNIGGVKMRVVLDKKRDGVVTAYPVNGKANACKSNRKAKSATRKQKGNVVAQSTTTHEFLPAQRKPTILKHGKYNRAGNCFRSCRRAVLAHCPQALIVTPENGHGCCARIDHPYFAGSALAQINNALFVKGTAIIDFDSNALVVAHI